MSPSPSDSARTPTVAAVEVIRVSAVVLARPDRRVLTVRKAGTAMFMFPGGKHLPGEAPVAVSYTHLTLPTTPYV